MRYLVIILCAFSGCTVIKYRELEIVRFGYDTKIGKLEGSVDPETGAVKLLIENADSNAAAVKALAELAARAAP